MMMIMMIMIFIYVQELWLAQTSRRVWGRVKLRIYIQIPTPKETQNPKGKKEYLSRRVWGRVKLRIYIQVTQELAHITGPYTLRKYNVSAQYFGGNRCKCRGYAP